MILSIYHEIVKMASQKKHYIMLIGFAFLMVLMVFVYWKFQNRFSDMTGGMVNGMSPLMKVIVPDPKKLCDGLMCARFSCQILFLVLMPIFAFMFAGEAIACEQQDGTLRAYLSRGFSRTQFVIAKFIAVFLVILFYSMLFAALTMLIGIVFFGISKMQITLFMGVPWEFSSSGLVSAKKAIASYYLATLYSAFAMSAISSVSFMISAFVKRMTVAATGGLVFFFVSLIMQLAFSDLIEDIKPFLITRVLDGYSQMFTIDAVNWDSIIKSVAVMCIYWSVCVATPVVVLNIKEY